jgi:thymidylate kinase
MTKKTALLIIEGVDGAGKTTLAQECMRQIEMSGRSCRSHHFPSRMWTEPQSGIDWGSASALERANWFYQDFSQGMGRLLAHDPDFIVLDRSYISTLVYQGFDLSNKKIAAFDMLSWAGAFIFAADQRIGTITLAHMDTPADVCAQRIVGRGAGKDEFDALTLDRLHDKLLAYKERYEIAFEAGVAAMRELKQGVYFTKSYQVEEPGVLAGIILDGK